WCPSYGWRRQATPKCLLDHAVATQNEGLKQCPLEGTCGLQIDDQLELLRTLHRQVAGPGASENRAHVVGAAADSDRAGRVRCRCSVKMSSPRGYQSRRAKERRGPRAEGVPSGAGVGIECFCDVAGAIAGPPNTPWVSSLLATQLGGDTFT